MEEIQIISLAAITWCQQAAETDDKEQIAHSRAFAQKILPLLGVSDEAKLLAAAMDSKKTESGIIL